MQLPLSRRAVVAGTLALGSGALVSSPARRYLGLLAPGSGGVWADLGPPPSGPISSPYGDATITYDDDGVPHIEADDERALQFAHGFAQGYDRLFQMDLYRRQMHGRLSEVVGPVTLESDVFHVRFGFAEAATASREALEGSETGAVLQAFVDGVNHARDRVANPIEAALLDYRIEPWTITDSLLIEKLLGWQLTGNFRTLRRVALGREFDEATVDALFPARYDHDVPILRDTDGGRLESAASVDGSVTKPTVDWLSRFEPPPGIGSNSWIVSGEHTASGGPLLANDPHLLLTAPPIWYELGLETPAFATRGVTFPGTPFVVIGRNRRAAWGFTTVGADVLDFYTYEIEGDEYRIGDDWFRFDTDEHTIDVAGEADHTITVRRTSHGPMIDRHGSEVAARWTGHGATRTIESVRSFQFAESLETFRDALTTWDLPPQNLVYADRDGRTMYQLVGKVPIRRTGGEPVRGDRIFDGTAEEGDWSGFEPFGQPTWEGFLSLDQLPHAIDAQLVATANQRVVDDPSHYLAESYSTPFRAMRLYDRLDAAIASGSVDADQMQAIQQDVVDTLAQMLVPEVVQTVDPAGDDARTALDALDDWDGAMRTDSFAALVFAEWLEAFRESVFAEAFDEAGFDRSYWPSDWVLATLPAEHAWFDRVGSRDEHVEAAFVTTIDRLEDRTTLGDEQVTELNHPLELGFLSYPTRAMPGSPRTLKNYRREPTAGPGWQMVADLGEDAVRGRLAGGNAGRRFSSHYADQFDDWIDGRYKGVDWEAHAERTLAFRGEGR